MRLKLMTDYDCYPLWDSSGVNIDPHAIGISATLVVDLMAWADKYDATLNRDNPRNSGFPSEQEEVHFRDEGERLRARLQRELGDSTEVVLVT